MIYLLVGAMPSFAPAWLRAPSVIAGILLPLILFGCARARLGTRAALLGALAVAVAPYMVTYSNLARGFMPADLALLIMIWCLLAQARRSACGAGRRSCSPARWPSTTSTDRSCW